MTYAARFETLFDEMVAAVDGDGAVVQLSFVDGRDPVQLVSRLGKLTWDQGRLAPVRRQLDEYFAGRRQEFDLPLRPRGTDFQHRVWSQVRRIGYGETASYGEVASLLRKSGASRAVGRANAVNPVCLLTPCHRVVGADGSLTGFGGGIETKRRLLELESGQAGLWADAAL